ncbi:MAG: hypothetical protein HQL39_15160, partial [Alphaproteobacteria bacterium]|nr:hypothetical protein [Alphaproteobacteria bacterium]
PLPDFIESIYLKGFGRTRPETVRTIEETAAARLAKKAERKARRAAERKAEPLAEPVIPDFREDGDERPD